MFLNKKLPKIAILTIVLLGSFLFKNNVKASTIGTSLNGTAEWQWSGTATSTLQSFTVLKNGYLNTVVAKLTNTSGTETCQVEVNGITDPAWPDGAQVGLSSGSTLLTTNDFGPYDWQYNTSTSISYPIEFCPKWIEPAGSFG